jgi:hypothetical protein
MAETGYESHRIFPAVDMINGYPCVFIVQQSNDTSCNTVRRNVEYEIADGNHYSWL